MKRILFLLLILLLALPCAAESAFVDDAGETIVLPAPPQSVVSLYGSFAECVLDAGGTLTGATRDAITERGLALPGVQIVGTVKEPSLEAVLALNPDFVLVSSSISSQMELRETLMAAGIPCAAFSVEHYTDYLRMMKVLTAVFGAPERYEAIEQAVKAPIEEILSAREDALEKTCLLLRAYSTGVRSKGSDSMAGRMLKDLGLVNIADSQTSLLDTLNPEAILEKHPDYVFITQMGGTDEEGEAWRDQFLQDPVYSSLRAVKAGHVYYLPSDLFHYKPNLRWKEAYAYLEKILDA